MVEIWTVGKAKVQNEDDHTKFGLTFLVPTSEFRKFNCVLNELFIVRIYLLGIRPD